MRVMFVTREGHKLSGARIRCYGFAQALARQGMEAEVLSFADHLGAKFGEHEVEMSLIEKMRLNQKAMKVLLREPRETVFILQRANYHVLAPLLVALVKKNRFVFDCDDWNIRENPVYHFGFYPSSKMEYAVRKIAGRARACIAASRYLEDYLRSFNSKVFYVPTGVDTELFSPQPRQVNLPTVFSWIGTAYHPEMGENLRFILSCFSAVADRCESVALKLAGEGKYFEEIRKEVMSCKHREKIEISSWISPEKIPEYLAATDVGLLPLVQDTQFNKAKSPTKLFEYMSMAKATISSARGEAAHIICDGENGFLAKDAEAFRSRMELLVKSPKLRQDMGRKGRETIEAKYSLKVLGRQFAAMLQSF